MQVFRNACESVCVYRGKSEHKSEDDLSDLIKQLAVLPLTYSKETKCSTSNLRVWGFYNHVLEQDRYMKKENNHYYSAASGLTIV